MSKIDELIAQYCPDGVEYKELKELSIIGTGNRNGNEGIEDGHYPLYVRSKYIKAIDSYDFDEEAIIIPGEGGIGEIFHYVNGKYALHQRAYRISLINESILTKYVYFYMLSNFKSFIYKVAVNATVSSIRKPMIEKFPIPIPPLPVQEEIVSILDKFTALEAELEAELEARTRQFEYYRNELLSFEGKDVEWKALGEVSFYSKSRIAASEICSNTYVGVDNLLQNKKGKTYSTYVPTSGNLTKFIPNDILIGNIRPYLKKIWKSNISGGTNGDVLVIRINEDNKTKINPDYLYYLLSSDSFFDFNMQYAKGAKMPRGDKESILKYSLPIPPIEEQERVVGILDKFDALVNDISTGLPAEIQARRQQYEYYRGKLLTFEPLTA